VDRQPKARGCLSRRRRGGNLDVFTTMSRRAAPKQASQTRKPNPQAKPERLAQHKPAVGGAGCRHSTIPGRFPAGAGRPSGGSLRRAIKIEPQADQPKGKLPRIRGQSERTW
jgi:hypothetical protein